MGLIELDWLGLAPHDSGYAAHQPRDVEWLNPGQVAELVPGLARPMEGALIHRQARVNPLRAVARLAAGLPAVATGVAATGVISAATASSGDNVGRATLAPVTVVFATGRPPVLDGLPLHIPSDRVKGHLLVTEQHGHQLPGIVAPLATQIEDGQLLAGGTFDLGDESPAVQPDVIDAIAQGLAAVLPGLSGVGIAYQWCCFRPRHPDRRPVIDKVPGLANAWLTSGHFRTGILNAPVTAAVLSRWIAAECPQSRREPGQLPVSPRTSDSAGTTRREHAAVVREPLGDARGVQVLQQRDSRAPGGVEGLAGLRGRERLLDARQHSRSRDVGTRREHHLIADPHQLTGPHGGGDRTCVQPELAQPVGVGRGERRRRQVRAQYPDGG